MTGPAVAWEVNAEAAGAGSSLRAKEKQKAEERITDTIKKIREKEREKEGRVERLF